MERLFTFPPQVLLNIYQTGHYKMVKMINKGTKVEDPSYNPFPVFVIVLLRDK